MNMYRPVGYYIRYARGAGEIIKLILTDSWRVGMPVALSVNFPRAGRILLFIMYLVCSLFRARPCVDVATPRRASLVVAGTGRVAICAHASHRCI